LVLEFLTGKKLCRQLIKLALRSSCISLSLNSIQQLSFILESKFSSNPLLRNLLMLTDWYKSLRCSLKDKLKLYEWLSDSFSPERTGLLKVN
jgi:hypothetical protein